MNDTSGAPDETRQLLIDAATREFAAEGVHGASLLEVTRQAGQRNRGAVHYHFGSRVGILVAVLGERVDFLAAREAELLGRARGRSDDDIASCLEAIVRPAVELSGLGPLGRAYLMILAELTNQGPDAQPPQVIEVLTRFGGFEIYELLRKRMPPMDEDLRLERTSMIAAFVLKSVADRARATDVDVTETASMRPQLETERFIANLIAMGVGMATAAVPEA